MQSSRQAVPASRIRGVLFDKDGTLIDFDRSWEPVNRKACLLAAGGDVELAQRLSDVCGMDFKTGKTRGSSLFAAGNARDIAAGMVAAGSPVPFETLTAELDRLFVEGAGNAVAITDTTSLFRQLKSSGLKVGIASSDNEASIRRCLATLQVPDSDIFVAGYDSGYGVKPGPGMVLAFCEASGVQAVDVLVVGDNTHDLDMGHAAGAGIVAAVLSGTGSRGVLGETADVILASVADLPAFLGLSSDC